MRRLTLMLCLVAFTALGMSPVFAGTYVLSDGHQYTGEPITIRDDGVIIKTGEATYSPRLTWDKFTQDALKTLLADAKTPNERAMIQPLIDEPVVPKANKADIAVKPITAPPRPTQHLGISALFSSPLGLLIFVILYGATIFAGYEVAVFRDQPIGLVCGFAAVPFIGVLSPIAFLFVERGLPRIATQTVDAPATREPAAPAGPVTTELAEVEQQPAPQPQRRVLAQEQPKAKFPDPVVFRRGDFVFNRRFFETKLANFQRLVPSAADKDMVVYIKAVRGEYVGRRITQITPDNLHLQVFKGEATADETIPFAEVLEVQIRHKDIA